MQGARSKVQIAALLALSCLLSGPAAAHVGPSEKTNNRYYKLTPMSDRVRLAYTIFFGREPGLVARRHMDLDRDGVLSASEIASYGRVIAKELFASVSFQQAGQDTEILWQDADVGLGRLDVSAEPFSVDFIATVCLDQQALGYEHSLVFRDRFRLPRPGETELSMAPAPGIRITRSVLGGRPSRHSEKWQGGPGAAQEGYEFAFVVESDELAVLDQSCVKPSAPRSKRRLAFVFAAALGLVLVGVYFVRRRRDRG